MSRIHSLIVAIVVTAVLAPAALGFGFNDESQLPHNGLIGQPFSYQLGCRAGSTPYSFRKDSGVFPPGVTLSSNGLLAGVPTKAGTFKFWCNATDGYVNPMHSQREITIIIEEPGAAAGATPPKPDAQGTSLNWPKPGWILTFHDEFDGKAVDLKNFVPRFDNHPEMPNVFEVRDGVGRLRIDRDTPTTRPDGQPGRVSALETREAHNGFAQKYGWFEVRARGIAGSGFGAGAWLLPIDKKYKNVTSAGGTRADADEPTLIDIFEHFGKGPMMNYFTVHFGADKNDDGRETNEVNFPVSLADDFHVYALEWKSDGLSWYVDGKEVHRSNKSPQSPFFLRVALFEGDIVWRGPVDRSTYPKDFEIDYVRVYTKAE